MCLQCRRDRRPGFARFRRNTFILVSSRTELLFLFCSHFWALKVDFKVILKWITDFFLFFFFAILYLGMRLILSEMIKPLSASTLSRAKAGVCINPALPLGSKGLTRVYSTRMPMIFNNSRNNLQHTALNTSKRIPETIMEKPFLSSQDRWRLGLLILRQRTALLTNKMYD